MQRSRRELLDDLLKLAGESPTDEKARNIAEVILNMAVETVWAKHTWTDFLSPAPYRLTLVVDQRRYALPDYFGRVGPGGVRNTTRPGKPIEVVQPHHLPTDYMTDNEQAGHTRALVLAGTVGVKTQPAAAGESLEVVSDNATDTDVQVSVQGDDVNGEWTNRSFNLNGTTPVAVGTWAYVDGFGKAYRVGYTPVTEYTSSRGTVTLRKVTGGTVLERLYPEESAHEHKMLTVYPKPDAADVLSLPVLRRPKRMLYDGDPTPGDWSPPLFEEMQILWRVQAGELSDQAALVLPRPALKAAIENDNLLKMQFQRRGYGGYSVV